MTSIEHLEHHLDAAGNDLEVSRRTLGKAELENSVHERLVDTLEQIRLVVERGDEIDFAASRAALRDITDAAYQLCIAVRAAR